MKTLNIRLLLILIVSAAVLLVGVYFLREWQMARNADFFLHAAETAQAEADQIEEDEEARLERLKEAAQNLAWYVRYRPEEVDALASFGSLQMELGNPQGAFRTLESVVRKDPSRNESRRKLVELAIAFRRFSDAKSHLDVLLREQPDDPELIEQLGICQMMTDQEHKAVESYRKAIALDASRLSSYRYLAWTLRNKLDESEEADQAIVEMVEQNPDSVEALLLAGNYHRAQQEFEKASEYAAKALELEPDNRDALWLAAQTALGQNKLPEARELAQEGVDKHPDYVPMYTTMSDIEARDGNRDQAMEWLRRGMAATERHPQLVWHLGRFLIDDGQLAEAEKLVKELRETDYSPSRITYLDASISFARNRWRQAAEQFTEVRSDLTPWPSLVKRGDYCRGICYQQMGQLERAETAFRAALAIDRFFRPARAGLARVLQQTGQLDESQREWRSIIQLSNDVAAATEYARVQLMRTLRQPPESRNWANFEQLLREIEENKGDSLDVLKLRIEMLLARDQADEAKQLILQAREEHPEEFDLWRILATLAMREEKWDEAEAILDEAEQQFGDSADLRLARGRMVAARHGADAAKPLAALLESTDKLPEGQTVALKVGVMELAERIGADELFLRLADEVLQERPENVALHFKLFDHAVRNRDREAMEKHLAALRRVEGEGPHWLFGRAVLLTLDAESDGDGPPDTAKLNKALNLLERAQEKRSRWSRVPLLMAGVHEQLGQHEKAIDFYGQAIDLGERSPNAFRRLVTLLNQRGLYTEARQRLDQMTQLRVQGTEALERLRMQTLLGTGDLETALEQARETAKDSEQARDHVWLARLLATVASRQQQADNAQKASELLEEADRSLKQAIELEPEAAAPYLAMTQFYLATERRGDAMGVVDRLRENVPEDGRALALAQAYEMIDAAEQALAAYKKALADNPKATAPVRALADFHLRHDNPEQAEELATRLLEDASLDSSEADRAWARRLLARILINRGGYANLTKAQRLIDQNLQAGGSESDRRFKAMLASADPSRASQEQAREMLEQLYQDAATRTPQDMFKLAQIYLKEDNWSRARDVLRDLVASYPDQPQYLAAYVEALLNHDETADAATYLDRLDELVPNNASVYQLRADLHFRNKDYEQALEVMKQLADANLGPQSDEAARLRLAASRIAIFAGRLRERGEDDLAARFANNAESLYRRFVQLAPQQRLSLATFLAGQGSTAEAVEILEEEWQTAQPGQVAQATSNLLKSDAITDAERKRAEKIVADALAKSPDSIPLLLVMADVRTNQQRYDDAEQYYRQILEAHPDHAITLNNLAVLLALQDIKLNEAREMIEKAIRLAGPVPAMLDSRATVMMALGEYDQALADMEEVVADGATDVRLFHQAQAQLLAGNRRAARRTLQAALDKGLEPDDLMPLEQPILNRLLRELQ